MEEREGPWDMFEIKSRGAMFDVRRSKKGRIKAGPRSAGPKGSRQRCTEDWGGVGLKGGQSETAVGVLCGGVRLKHEARESLSEGQRRLGRACLGWAGGRGPTEPTATASSGQKTGCKEERHESSLGPPRSGLSPLNFCHNCFKMIMFLSFFKFPYLYAFTSGFHASA